MVLETQIVNIPLTGGVDTKTSEKLVAPGSNLKTENVVMVNTGEIKKRNGYENLTTSVSDGSTLNSATSLYSYNGRLVLMGNDTNELPGFYSYAEADEQWISSGYFPPVTFDIERITGANTTNAQPSVADSTNMRMIAYQYDDASSYYHLIDKNTGTKYKESDIYTLGISPRIAYIDDAYGQHFLGMGISPEYDWIKGIVLDIDTPTTAPSTHTFVTDSHGECIYDLDVISYGAHYDESRDMQLDAYSEAVLAYKRTDDTIGIKTFNGEGEIHKSIIIDDEPINSLTVKYINDSDNGERIYLVYQDSSGNIVGYAFDPDLNEVVSAQSISTSYTARTIRQMTISANTAFTNTRLSLWFELSDTEEYNFQVEQVFLKFDLSPAGANPSHLYHSGLASKAFTHNNNSYVLICHDSASQSCYFLVSPTSTFKFRFPAKIFYGSGGGVNWYQGLSAVTQTGSNLFTIALLRQSRFISASEREKQIATVSFNMDPDPLPSVQIGPSMLIGGGIITCFDGKSQEHGFHLYPENIAIEGVDSTGGGVGDGYRSFKAMYQWIDRNGELQQSGTSEAIGTTFSEGTDTQEATVDVNYLEQYDHDNKTAYIELYRTINNGSTYYLEPKSRTINYYNIETLSNENASDTSDFDIQGCEILYTKSGEVPNIGPPGSKIIVSKSNRVFLVPMDDTRAIWYSKPKIEGQAINFSDEMIIRLEEGGPITGLAVMDNNVIVFKENGIYYISGSGPNALNEGTAFYEPAKVATDIGCVNHNSIVVTNIGTIFKSRKGIYLLNRSLQTQYIGAPVEYYNSWNVVKSILVEDKNQVRIMLSGGQPMLVYDYYHNQWSTWTNHAGQDAIIHDNEFYWVTSAGQVKHETENEYLDTTYRIPITIKTPWIKLSGIQNYQRVKRAMIFGEFRSNHTLTVTVYINYNDSSSVQTVTYSTTGGNHVAGEPYQFEFQIGNEAQKCQSIMFEISDGSYAGTYESVRLSGMSLIIGMKRGMAKLPDRKQV